MTQNDSDLGGNEPDPRLQLTKIANTSEDFEKKARLLPDKYMTSPSQYFVLFVFVRILVQLCLVLGY